MINRAALEGLLGSDWRIAAANRRAEIEGRVAGRTDVLLFGAGALGRRMLADLVGLPFTPVAFVDNDARRWGSAVDGLRVIGPDEAVGRTGRSALWLITVYTNSAVIAQIQRLGMPWITCAELSWIVGDPRPESLHFGTPEQLAASANSIVAASDIWADEESATEYRAQIRWRFLLDYAALPAPRPAGETYFPDDLVTPLANEVFIDCGALTGDTIQIFLEKRAAQFRRIVAIEPDVISRRALEERVRNWSRSGLGPFEVEPVAVGSRRGRGSFESSGTVTSKLGTGADLVDVVPLDEILLGRHPTYIKFDIEGAEHDALLGASATLRSDMPVLAVSAYHKPEDVWDLPLLIRSVCPDYRMYLRRYSDERWETVLYAVPPGRVPSGSSGRA